MKKILITSFLISLLSLNACKSSSMLAPAIRFQNSSPDGSVVRNIYVVWNGHPLLKESGPIFTCGNGGSQSHYINNFFGPVHVEWENANGQKLTKDFVFKKEDLPSYKYRHLQDVYSFVTLYFTQFDVEYYTSDNPRIKEIAEEKTGNWVIDYIEGKGQICVKNPKEVKRLKELKKRTTYCLNNKGEKIDCDNLHRKFYYDSDGKVKELK